MVTTIVVVEKEKKSPSPTRNIIRGNIIERSRNRWKFSLNKTIPAVSSCPFRTVDGNLTCTRRIAYVRVHSRMFPHRINMPAAAAAVISSFSYADSRSLFVFYARFFSGRPAIFPAVFISFRFIVSVEECFCTSI